MGRDGIPDWKLFKVLWERIEHGSVVTPHRANEVWVFEVENELVEEGKATRVEP